LIDYPRHFALLSAFAALLLVASPWRAPGVYFEFALYGALHAAALVLNLRPRRPVWRQGTFVALAALLCTLIGRLGLYGLRFGPLPTLASSAAAGAVAYGMLIRIFLAYALPAAALAKIALGCLVATLAAFIGGASYPVLGGLWLAVAWWLAFSGGLWYEDHRRRQRLG
jgi:hypothetical protein